MLHQQNQIFLINYPPYQIDKYGDSLAFNRTYTYLNNKKTKDLKSVIRKNLENKQDYITKKIIERNERGN